MTILDRNQRLQGYEIYLVEQWACSRTEPTFIITTYTGDPASCVMANVVGMPTSEADWTPQLRTYFRALHNFHARRRETSLGTVMITNLSGFPSSLPVIPIPDGDAKKHRELFFVNENLKRLGCSGRMGVKLVPPTGAVQAKFHQLYRTSEKVALSGSVIELVKLCQVALYLFDKLENAYVDGLLCDMTEKAINDWWIEFGTEYYNIEPQDGILGPTTVSALLGMLMGARNRLAASNAPTTKDVFDIECTKRAITHFQKSQHMPRTRRLDRQTLESLRRATAKAASGEGWGMPRALQKTVAELGGKGGEMVMGMVSGRDKAGIAEIETVDYDRFVELVHGEHAKWLWYGKPRKHASGDMFSRLPADQPRDDVDDPKLQREGTADSMTAMNFPGKEEKRRTPDLTTMMDGSDKDPFSKRAAIRKATGKIEVGGLGRIKGAVGRRSHPQKCRDDSNLNSAPADALSSTALASSPWLETDHVLQARSAVSDVGCLARDRHPHRSKATDAQQGSGSGLEDAMNPDDQGSVGEQGDEAEDQASKPPTATESVAGSVRQRELPIILPRDESVAIGNSLRRTQSSDPLDEYRAESRNDDWWPRRLSFSIAEESIFVWQGIADCDPPATPSGEMAKQLLSAEEARCLRERLVLLSKVDAAWVREQLDALRSLDKQADQDLQELDVMYYPRLDEFQELREHGHALLSRERTQLREAVKDVETLGAKLEYEINALRGKVDDAEDGVAEFERQVLHVERRVRELEKTMGQRETWLHWMCRVPGCILKGRRIQQ